MPRTGTKVFVLVRVLRPVCFAIFDTVDSGAKGIGFIRGFALFFFPSVHVRAFRLLNAAHGHESTYFSKGSVPFAFFNLAFCQKCLFFQYKIVFQFSLSFFNLGFELKSLF